MIVSDSSNAQTEYPNFQFTYTTADIENNTFFGETPDPFYFAMPEPLTEVSRVIFRVIDGELREVRDETPPGAKLPSSRLLELVK